MARIEVTPDEKVKLEAKGYLFKDEFLPGADGPAKGYYHNPRTGQEFKNLPTDPLSMSTYFGRGLRLGRLPSHLREMEMQTQEVISDTAQGARSERTAYSAPKSDSEALMDVIAALAKEVRELKSQIKGEPVTIEEEGIEYNTQLEMF